MSQVASRRPGSSVVGALFAVLVLAATPSRASAAVVPSALRPEALRLPFVANAGQDDPAVAYAARAGGTTLFVTRAGELVYSLRDRTAAAPFAGPGRDASAARGWTLTEAFVGGKPLPAGRGPAPTRVDFLVGDESAWRCAVPTYAEVALGEVWSGVDVRLRSEEGRLEKVFTIGPGADASRIRVAVAGAERLDVEDDGALAMTTGLGRVTLTPPVAWQMRDGRREPVAVAYAVSGRAYGFRVGPHDAALPVVVDPILQSTYAGGAGSFDDVNDIAFHPTSGDVYAAGFTNSAAFPGVAGGSQASYGGGNNDGFVARFDADLTTLTQATFFGGSNFDQIYSVTVSAGGDVFVTGETNSTNLAGTTGKAQPGLAGGTDGFVAKFGPTLTGAVIATYFGGTANDHPGRAIAVHPTTGKIYVGGWGESKNFPGTAGGAQASFTGSFTGWVTRLAADLSAVEQSTYVGEVTQIFAIAIGSSGIYVAGHAGLPPDTTGGAQTTAGDTSDAFLTLLPPALTSFTRSTFYGGDALDTAFGLAINGTSGDVYIAGGTSSLNLPGAFGHAQPIRQGPTDNYVARLKGDLTAILGATYSGGTGADGANAVDVDEAGGTVYIAGTTTSTKFPGTSAGAQRIYGGGSLDAFVVRFDAALTARLAATFLGGGPDAGNLNNSGDDESITVRIHPATGEVYTAGYTSSSDFPKRAGGAQATRGGAVNDSGVDGYVTRLTADLLALFAPQEIVVDPAPGASADGNGVLEPGETVSVEPAWKNATPSTVSLSGAASSPQGPPGATYALPDAAAAYGSLAAGATGSCADGPNCFSVSVSAPGTRPASHWDMTFLETPSPADAPMQWTLHIGDSFTDVPRSHGFYRKIETLFHNGVTVGCTGTQFCLNGTVPRVNMAIFIARAIAGGAGFLPNQGTVNGTPYRCLFFMGASLFSDVTPTDIACPAVHYLAALNVATGCAPGVFCTVPNVNRGEMAIFMARAVVAPGGGAAVPNAYGPDPNTGRSYSCSAGSPNLHFTDVSTTDIFCKHVHFLWARGVVDGCSPTQYCPAANITRGEMAKFLSNSFVLPLYAP